MVNKPNLLDNIEAAGKTWAFFEESMPAPCYKQTAGRYYAPDELPWAYFSDIADNPARCRAHVLPMGDMRADLASAATTPNFVWAEPNACDDMKQCGIAAGDRYLQQTMSQILSSEAWNSPTQRSAIFLTWDEDFNNLSLGIGNEGNYVPMIVIPSPPSEMRHGRFTATGDYNHYSLQRTIEAALGLPSLTDNDKYATPLNQFWP
jgi:hypothetical protein